MNFINGKWIKYDDKKGSNKYRLYDSLSHKLEKQEKDVMGYFYGNCIHCHFGGDVFNLQFPAAKENLVRVKASSLSKEGYYRVKPGCPEQSVLWLATSWKEHPEFVVPQMPPVGVQMRDSYAAEVIGNWISSMPGSCSDD